ncbi:MAG: ComF family protein [Anaerolineae bacterium]|nr:ComF family protein [Anaerolineae bacterium]MDW8299774.1 ComF family protein [Anaerolineae bacterium]
MPRLARLPASKAGILLDALWQSALDFFFPPHCLACGRIGSRYCPHCLAELPFPPISYSSEDALRLYIAAAPFEGALREAIHALKYKGVRQLAPILAERLAQAFKQSDFQAQAIVALPLHAERLAQRGYNQSALLAEQLAARLRLPYLPEAAQRIRNTAPQVGLNRQERAANVADAFRADPEQVRGLRLVLVDDVVTTGATMRACAEALCSAGAAEICGLSVAVAVLH